MKAKKIFAGFVAATLALSFLTAFAAEADDTVNGWTKMTNNEGKTTTLTAVGEHGVKVSGEGGYLFQGGVVGAETKIASANASFKTTIAALGAGEATEELVIGLYSKPGGAFAEGQTGIYFEFVKDNYGQAALGDNEYAVWVKTKASAEAAAVPKPNGIWRVDLGKDKTAKVEIAVVGNEVRAYLNDSNMVANISQENGKTVGYSPLSFALADIGITGECYLGAQAFSTDNESTGTFEFTTTSTDDLWRAYDNKTGNIERISDTEVKLTANDNTGIGAAASIADPSKAKIKVTLTDLGDNWGNALLLNFSGKRCDFTDGLRLEVRPDYPKGDGTWELTENEFAFEFKCGDKSVVPVGGSGGIVGVLDLGASKELKVQLKDNGDETVSLLLNGSDNISDVSNKEYVHTLKFNKADIGYDSIKYFAANAESGEPNNFTGYNITLADVTNVPDNEPGEDDGEDKKTEDEAPEKPEESYNGWNVFENADTTAEKVGTDGIHFNGKAYLLDGTVGGSIETSMNKVNYTIQLNKLGDGTESEYLVICFGSDKNGLIPTNKGFYLKLKKKFPGFELGENEYSVELMSYDDAKNGNGYIIPANGPSFIGKVDLGNSKKLTVQLKKSGDNVTILLNGKSVITDISSNAVIHQMVYPISQCGLESDTFYMAVQAFTGTDTKAKTSVFDFTVTDNSKKAANTDATTNMLFVVPLLTIAIAGATVILLRKKEQTVKN